MKKNLNQVDQRLYLQRLDTPNLQGNTKNMYWLCPLSQNQTHLRKPVGVHWRNAMWNELQALEENKHGRLWIYLLERKQLGVNECIRSSSGQMNQLRDIRSS